MRISHVRIFQLQRLSAIGLVVFLTTHMVVAHYPPGHLDFSRVMERMAYPLWKGIDIMLLASALIHAITGMYMVLTDVEKVSRYRSALGWASVILFGAAFVYGTITILAFQPPQVVALP
jgi:succinate dehydrogenase hydrophobic anchor subunit